MNLFFVSNIILSFTSFLLGFLVYLKDRKSSLGKRWFALSVSIAGWAVLLYLVASSSSSAAALRWQYLLDIVALGIPVTYLHFVTTFLDINASRQMRVFGGAALQG